jgi:hypothetical protein
MNGKLWGRILSGRKINKEMMSCYLQWARENLGIHKMMSLLGDTSKSKAMTFEQEKIECSEYIL